MVESQPGVASRRAVLTAGAAGAVWAAPVVVAAVATPAHAASGPEDSPVMRPEGQPGLEGQRQPPADVTFTQNGWAVGQWSSRAIDGLISFHPQWQLKSGFLQYQVSLHDADGVLLDVRPFTFDFTNQQSRFRFEELTSSATYTVSVLVLAALATSWLENDELVMNEAGAPVLVVAPSPVSVTVGNW